jgi:microsomal epoxide hydrolase
MSRTKISALVLLLFSFRLSDAFSEPKNSAPITEGETTTQSGIRIHYLQSGNRKSPNALVLIPGWRLPAYLWTGQLIVLSDTNRVIAIDPRSQSQSTKTTEGNTPEIRAKDLHDVLRKLDVTRAVLVGWSQGAQDVAAYVQYFGTESLAGVIFVDSPVSIGPKEIEQHKQFSTIVLSNLSNYVNDPTEFSRRMVQSMFKQPHPELDMDKIVDSSLQTPPDIGAFMLVMDIFGADRQTALAKLAKPALVVASADSPLLEYQKEMASVIPGAQFLIIEGAGHAVFVDQPEKFDTAVRAFLKGLPEWTPSQGHAP